MLVATYHNGDDVFIAWKTDATIKNCRGFAIRRKRNGIVGYVPTWVGFEGDVHALGESRGSNEWPIQRYQWTDYLAEPGDVLQYQVVPMIGPKASMKPDEDQASEWTTKITLNEEVSTHIKAFFNRGIVASQWVSRRLDINEDDLKPDKGDHAQKKLSRVIDTPGDPMREFLMGGLGRELFAQLDSAAREGREIYAALYEFKDKQLEKALITLGQKAHVVLANGSWKQRKKTAQEKADKVVLPRLDQMKDVRSRLKGKIDLHDRMLRQGTLGHNKFMVICDKAGKPRWTWTGSTNWSKTGLCTQANNALLIDDADLALEYVEQWKRLKAAGGETPATLKKSNTTARAYSIGGTDASLWFTPTIKYADLDQARLLIENAKDAILFLMFNPGPADTSLLGKIVQTAMARPDNAQLYVRGALNQDPSTTKTPVILFDQKVQLPGDLRVVLPAAIDVPTEWFVRELKKTNDGNAMVHSKVIVVDPFGKNPIVITGSHNLGTKASDTNDENLLIIQNAPDLASAYATNIMSVYGQYSWRYNKLYKVPGSKAYKGLRNHEYWQPWHWTSEELQEYREAKIAEMNFWVGK